ncbi:phage integrase SAM-like domain-containing protein [Mucilaginibacter sp.]|uniref:phage integrase SAM-like domain-containing protein n=1 Tax=Mucilaginibacter sp. TaxID=1882438 RepID=UPI0025D0DFE4|nr:phage integrase SAM-like domain-containing protein [Mucilaginibacter sp.]
MATVREVVLPHHKKEDGTWNVKIRVTHKGKCAFINTQHFVCEKQLRKDFTIKDHFITDLINPVLKDYRNQISDLNIRLSYYNAKSLAHYLESGGQIRAEEINVIEFGLQQIEKLEKEKRGASAANMKTVVFSLIDFWKSDVVPITNIRAQFLEEYENFLKGPRTMTRLNQFKRPVTKKVKGLKKTGLHNHMRDLRILFNDSAYYPGVSKRRNHLCW